MPPSGNVQVDGLFEVTGPDSTVFRGRRGRVGFFGRELLAFLREQNMDSELATGSDLAALQIYVASADRVRHSVEHIWESAKDIWKPLCTQSPYPIEVSTQYGCVWKFRYLSRTDLRRSFIATGIRYPALSQHPAYSDPEGEHISSLNWDRMTTIHLSVSWYCREFGTAMTINESRSFRSVSFLSIPSSLLLKHRNGLWRNS